jgi:hypothetical protein
MDIGGIYMDMKEVMFKGPPISYMGRNGMGSCCGVQVMIYKGTRSVRSLNRVEVYPINSKGSVARCYIGIPQENINEVCVAMQSDLLGKVLDQVHDRLPTLIGLDPSLDVMIEQRLKGV